LKIQRKTTTTFKRGDLSAIKRVEIVKINYIKASNDNKYYNVCNILYIKIIYFFYYLYNIILNILLNSQNVVKKIKYQSLVIVLIDRC